MRDDIQEAVASHLEVLPKRLRGLGASSFDSASSSIFEVVVNPRFGIGRVFCFGTSQAFDWRHHLLMLQCIECGRAGVEEHYIEGVTQWRTWFSYSSLDFGAKLKR